MINIVSTQAGKTAVMGPQKVYANLVKGLDKLGYPYVVNAHPSAARRLWIHDDVAALRYMHHPGVHPVVGPNLFVMPEEIDAGVDFRGCVYLHPCDWAADFWRSAGFRRCPIVSWPVGIDTGSFKPADQPADPKAVMVYHKMRDPQELVHILDTLGSCGLRPRLALYGSYVEDEYRNLLREVSLVVWHGCAESQGIALQEALACNVPVLVCDVTTVQQTRGGFPFSPSTYSYPVSAAPYFDDRCGVRITDLHELRGALETMLLADGAFHPREYVSENLSLDGQARKLIEVWERWGLAYCDGLDEELRTRRQWHGLPRYRRRIDRGKVLLQTRFGRQGRGGGG